MFKMLFLILVLGSLLLAGCNLGVAVPATQNVPTLVAETLPPEVIIEIQNQASEALAVAAEQIQIETVEQQDWPDACLGLPNADEACAQVITPGWLVVIDVGGTEYRYRVGVHETGTNIRQEP